MAWSERRVRRGIGAGAGVGCWQMRIGRGRRRRRQRGEQIVGGAEARGVFQRLQDVAARAGNIGGLHHFGDAKIERGQVGRLQR